MFEKELRYGWLLDFYGELLSDRKRQVMNCYYNEDMSLSEIATLYGISRQGVSELIKKSCEELSSFEEKLGLAERFSRVEQCFNEMAELLAKEMLSPGAREKLDTLFETVGENL